jgi:hypothetical protein
MLRPVKFCDGLSFMGANENGSTRILVKRLHWNDKCAGTLGSQRKQLQFECESTATEIWPPASVEFCTDERAGVHVGAAVKCFLSAQVHMNTFVCVLAPFPVRTDRTH